MFRNPIFQILWLLIAVALFESQPALSQARPGPSGTVTYHIGVKFFNGAARKPVPFELVQGIIVFRARVAGREVWAMLDNLARQTTINLNFARSAGIVLDDHVDRIATVNGSIAGYRTAPVEIVVPGQMIATAPVSAADIEAFTRLIGRPIDLVLGGEYFDNLAFVIRPTGNFEIGNGGLLNIPPNVPAIPLLEGKYRVAANINGLNVILAVDLGSNSAIKLIQSSWQLVAAGGHNFRTIQSAGVEGKPITQPLVAVPNVLIGPVKLGEVDVEAGPANGNEGLIGTGILSRFTVGIDGKGGKLWLIPTPIAGPRKP